MTKDAAALSNSGRRNKILVTILKQAICIGMVLIVITPILLTLFAALKTKGDMVKTSPLLLPSLDKITFENFA